MFRYKKTLKMMSCANFFDLRVDRGCIRLAMQSFFSAPDELRICKAQVGTLERIDGARFEGAGGQGRRSPRRPMPMRADEKVGQESDRACRAHAATCECLARKR
jgi:hypothetical protein